MTNETQPGIPEKWRKLYEFITQEYFTAQFIGSANLEIEPIKELIEENARLEAENGKLEQENSELKRRKQMSIEFADKQAAELTTLRAQLLESGRITDEALKQRDEALAKLEQMSRPVTDVEWRLVADSFTTLAWRRAIDKILASRAPATPEEKP